VGAYSPSVIAAPHACISKCSKDGQQRITSLYGIIRGKSPQFFEGNKQAFTGLYFNLDEENFEFYAPLKMQNNPLWINVTELMQKGVGIFMKNLALAKICALVVRRAQPNGKKQGLTFVWNGCARCINAVVTGEAMFSALKDIDTPTFQDGLNKAEKAIDTLLNLISNRLGLDHDRVLGSIYAFPVMVRYLVLKGGRLENYQERDKLLY
jgi:hypothetical protein